MLSVYDVRYQSDRNAPVITFEVGARRGLTNDNTLTLRERHKYYMFKHTKKTNFIKIIQSLARLSSYYMYTASN